MIKWARNQDWQMPLFFTGIAVAGLAIAPGVATLVLAVVLIGLTAAMLAE